MLIHAYIFLSTLFVGLQGVAVYRHKINQLSKVEVIEQAPLPENNGYRLWDQVDVPVNNAIELAEVKKNKNEILEDPNIINARIAEELNEIFASEEMEEVNNSEINIAQESEALGENELIETSSNALVEEDIVVFDYSKTQLAQVKNKIADVGKSQEILDVEKYLKKKNKKPVTNQTIASYTGEVLFQVVGPINDFRSLELNSIFGSDYVYVDKEGLGSITKNFASIENLEEYEAFYPQMMPVNFGAYWHQEEEIVNEVPLIEQARVSEWYKDLNIAGEWGMLLLKINNEIDYYELNDYKAMIFLDSALNESEENHAKYVLFLGVPPGNTELLIKAGDSVLNFMTHITQNSIRVESVLLSQGLNTKFSLFEKLPMTKDPKNLLLAVENIAPISNDARIEKETLNSYLYQSDVGIKNQLDSIAIAHNDEKIFVNINASVNDIVLPSKEYVNHVLDTAKEIDTSCIVELTSKRKIEYIETKFSSEQHDNVGGKLAKYVQEEMIFERHLDKDGIFYPTLSESTDRSYFMTEFAGQINFKIVFKDGSHQNRTVFCGGSEYHLEEIGE